MKHWLKEWWPLGLAFATFGCFLRVLNAHNPHTAMAWGMAFGVSFVIVTWWRDFKAMQKRHRDAIAAFEEKWGVRWEEVKRG